MIRFPHKCTGRPCLHCDAERLFDPRPRVPFHIRPPKPWPQPRPRATPAETAQISPLRREVEIARPMGALELRRSQRPQRRRDAMPEIAAVCIVLAAAIAWLGGLL